jgi:hypothetical protein
MPLLESLNNSFVLQSTNSSLNCSIFDTDHTKSIIKGEYICNGTHQTILGPPGNYSLTPGAKAGIDSLTPGDKAGIAVACLVIGSGLAFGAVFLIRRNKANKARGFGGDPIGGKAEMDDNPVPRRELATGQEMHELYEEHGITEVGTNNFHDSHELPG